MTMPSVGRVVHYVSRGSADGVFEATCRAAIVTDVPSDGLAAKKVDIAVLNPDGILFAHAIPYSDIGPIDEDGTPNGGTWHWPERV